MKTTRPGLSGSGKLQQTLIEVHGLSVEGDTVNTVKYVTMLVYGKYI